MPSFQFLELNQILGARGRYSESHFKDPFSGSSSQVLNVHPYLEPLFQVNSIVLLDAKISTDVATIRSFSLAFQRQRL